jgi:hypothetical protein
VAAGPEHGSGPMTWLIAGLIAWALVAGFFVAVVAGGGER